MSVVAFFLLSAAMLLLSGVARSLRCTRGHRCSWELVDVVSGMGTVR